MEYPLHGSSCWHRRRAGSRSPRPLFINPLQDYLYLQQKYFLEDAQSERINVPGSVNAFNWTYRMPVSVEALLQDEEFIQRVQKVVKIHDGK